MASPASISQGYWCPCVKNKSETKLFGFLDSNLTFDIKTQARFDWYKNIYPLPFDFLIEKLKVIIEIDGSQHFSQVRNWTHPDDTQKRDIYKMKCANFHGYSVIRIFQEDVWKDKNNWDINLLDCIKKYDVPVNIYIGNKYTHPYTKIGSVYPLSHNPLIDCILYISTHINDIIENEYYRTIIDNNEIDHTQMGKFHVTLLDNPYFIESLTSFIKHKKKRVLK
jgi:very-short-patch-repair endonuclease